MAIDLNDFQTTRHELSLPLLMISGSKGVLACGYLSTAALEKNGDAAAIVRGVSSFEDMLVAEIQEVTPQAIALGIRPGMTGQDALEVLK